MRSIPAVRVAALVLLSACSKTTTQEAPKPAPEAVVAAVFPGAGLPGVAADAAVTATFTKALDCTTVTASSFLLSSGAGPVTGTVGCSGPTATFTPSAPLAPATTYAVTLTPAVKDVSGAPLPAMFGWTFTTAPSACGTHAPVVATASALPSSVRPGLDTVQLTATSTDPDDACSGGAQPRTYLWSITSAPPGSSAIVSDPASPTPAFTPDLPGSYQLQVIVTDATGLRSSPAFVDVTATTCTLLAPSVAPFAPVASILGAAVTLPLPQVVDANCAAGGAAPSYQWTLVARPAGSAALLDDPAAPQPHLLPDRVGTYRAEVVATNAAGIASAPAAVDVVVSSCGTAAPVLPALSALPAAPNAGDLVTAALSAPVEDPNVACGGANLPYAYRWQLVARPAGSGAVLVGEASTTPSFVADVPGSTYQLALTVSDALGNTSAPAFLAVQTTSCGVNRPVVWFTPPPTAGVTANAPVPLAATATDPDTASCPARFASGIARVNWSVVAQPVGSHPLLGAASSAPAAGLAASVPVSNTFQADLPGTYAVEAVAISGNGTVGVPQRTLVTIPACGYRPPAVDALAVTDASGAAVSRPPVGSSVTLTALASDPDAADPACTAIGVPMAPSVYRWTLVSAPAGSAVASPSTSGASLAFVPDVAGSYGWQVVAVDPQGLVSQPMTVVVPTGTCGPVVAASPELAVSAGSNAGSLVTVSTAGPVSTPCVLGNGALTYAWSLSARPPGSAATMASPQAASSAFTADVPGTYTARLVLSDAGGNASVFERSIAIGGCVAPTIVQSATQPLGPTDLYVVSDPERGDTSPLIHAGARVTVGVPFAIVTRGGVVPGSCGGLAYEWSILSRPQGSGAVLSSATSPTPSFVPDVPNGVYQLAVQVRDGQGNASSPFFFSVQTDGCGTYPPSLSGALAVTPSAPRVGVPFTVTAPAASDGNAAAGCPSRFLATSYRYAFEVTPAGGAVGGDTSPSATVTVPQPGPANVSVVATSDRGVSSAPLAQSVSVSPCGTYPPVASAFAWSQGSAVPGGATAAVSGGAAAFSTGPDVKVPVQLSATVQDQDYEGPGSCGLPLQAKSYAWTLAAAPAGSQLVLSSPASAIQVFTPDVPGTYAFTLTTSDGDGHASTSQVTLAATSCGSGAITVPATAISGTQPSASFVVALPSNMALGIPVALSLATGSVTDPSVACGAVAPGGIGYRWRFTSAPAGSAATVLAADTATPSFTPDVPGTYQLEVTATDALGNQGTAPVTVQATCDVEPAVLTIPGTTTPDFTVTQSLIVNGGTPVTLVRASDPARDVPPSASSLGLYAGVPVSLSANVNGGLSSAPGCSGLYAVTLSYAWRILSAPPGSTAQLSDANGATPSFTPDKPGSYTFQLTLTDQSGKTSATTLSTATTGGFVAQVGSCGLHAPVITTQPLVTGPLAPVGSSPAEPVGLAAFLDAHPGTAPGLTYSLDDYHVAPYPLGCGLDRPLAYRWEVVSAPQGALTSFTSATASNPNLGFDAVGTYGVRLTVTDSAGNASARTAAFEGLARPGTTTGPVFTSTAIDPTTGNPVVAWWDGAAHEVRAARCTANCAGTRPSWSLLGPRVDGNLGALSFTSPDDEPRPVAVRVSSAGTITVAYHTGAGTAGATALGQPYCGASVATWSGSAWTGNGVAGGAPCAADLSSGTSYGRYLSLDLDATGPVLGVSAETSTGATPYVLLCADAGCTSTAVLAPGSGAVSEGKFISVRARGTTVDAAWAMDDGSTAELLYAECTSCRSTLSMTGAMMVGAPSSWGTGRFATLDHLPPTPQNALAGDEVVLTFQHSGALVALRCVDSGGGCPPGSPAWGVVIPTDPAGNPALGRGFMLSVDGEGLPRLGDLDTAGSVIRVTSTDAALTAPLTVTRELPISPTSPLGQSMAYSPGLGIGFVTFSSPVGPLVFTTP